ncbi:MAG: 50S ribosomal protein L9 [Candidatus Omnitrophica bacterium 4484_70.1]|nr:MAG: 50S ribosomal protein L9 [Candidatus Omnitrophica bacterium 4484_70.1]
MRVILLKEVKRLGKKGDIVEVKDGYARNYLIPYGFAWRANKESLKRFGELKKREEKLLERKRKLALNLKERLEKVSLTLQVEAKEDNVLYGSIGKVQIMEALREEGIEIEKDNIKLEEPIRKLGVYRIEIVLEENINTFVRVWIVKR